MSGDTPTPVQQLALALSSATGGEHGVSSRDGTKTAGTSAGLKQSGWSYSSELFSNVINSQESRYLGITMESSKAGGQAEAETLKPTESSGEFTSCWKITTQSSQQDTSTRLTTPQMVRREASTPQDTSYFPQSNSQMKSNPSSLTATPPIDPTNQMFLQAFLQNQR